MATSYSESDAALDTGDLVRESGYANGGTEWWERAVHSNRRNERSAREPAEPNAARTAHLPARGGMGRAALSAAPSRLPRDVRESCRSPRCAPTGTLSPVVGEAGDRGLAMTGP